MSKLLIVDDDSYVLRSLARLIKTHSQHDVEIFDDPELALEKIHEETFDVIISDYHMGKMNGVEFLERSQKLSPCSARILLSGLADMDVLAQTINRCGIYHYLPKPWNDEQLLDIISEAASTCKNEQLKTKAVDLVSNNKYGFSLGKLSDTLPINHSSHEVPCRNQTTYFEEIQAALQESVQLLGFEFFNYSTHVIDRTQGRINCQPGAIGLGNYPRNLLTAHQKNDLVRQADPVMRMIEREGLHNNHNPVYGTWSEAYHSMMGNLASSKRDDRARLMSQASELYKMASREGINFGIFMSVIDAHKIIVLHLATSQIPENKHMDTALWKNLYGICQLCNHAMRHVAACDRCSSLSSNAAGNLLTEKQKEVLKTFLGHSGASLKSVAKIHGISVDSVNFHLKNIRQTLNKPRTSPHALASLARSMDLI